MLNRSAFNTITPGGMAYPPTMQQRSAVRQE